MRAKLLNARHKKFIEAILDGEEPTTAARICGFSSQNAAHGAKRYMNNPLIRKELDEAWERIKSEKILTNIEAAALLTEIANHGKEKTADRIAAVTALAKMKGWMVPRTNPNKNKPTQEDAVIEIRIISNKPGEAGE